METTQTTKPEANTLDRIEVWELRRKRYFDATYTSGEISWPSGGLVAHVEVSTSKNPNIELSYTLKGQNGDVKDINYRLRLATSPCYFGGRRWWIVCQCGRRIGVLYRGDNYFRCRHCYSLTYRSRNEKKSLRSNPLFRTLNDVLRISNLKDKIKREVYGGEPTNNQRELNLLYAKLLLTTLPLSDNIKRG
ncbi:MAG: hypothetical protein G01um10147_1083 [Microgenomates group bacterium Gr01-1014_7]|nr:MAG: hypothetical protein G01um10147_1083 [Microgenomates group bacterium Gr01-1014_7]